MGQKHFISKKNFTFAAVYIHFGNDYILVTIKLETKNE